MNVPIVLDYIDQVLLGISAVQMRVEFNHLLAPHDVAVKVVHLSGQGIERADRPPLLVVARPWGYRGLQPPRRSDFRPALITKLIQKQRHDCVRMTYGL